ncbi:hypothetical protein [Streptomyces sp. NPDC047024]|uniref:hypothetical protein n=1 Tax=Streptomyces sp. NPDC047024 TaxID=3155476 RepID=UPI003410CD00
MTTPPPLHAESADPAPRLRGELVRLGHATRNPELSATDRKKVRRILNTWLPVAAAHRDAQSSRSATALWRELISDVRDSDTGALRPITTSSVYRAQNLIRALLEATQRGPSVEQLADRIRKSVANGDYPPGLVMPMKKLAAEVGYTQSSVVRVELAVNDLQAEGLVTVEPYHRFRIVGAATTHRPTQVADWLRVLIEGGVYPHSSPLPLVQQLARTISSSPQYVTLALRQLSDENLIHFQAGRRPTLRYDHPLIAGGGPPLEELITLVRLCAEARPTPVSDHDSLRQVCGRLWLWWRTRHMPQPAELDQALVRLIAAVEPLIRSSVARHPHDPQVQSIVRRAALTAAAPPPNDLDLRMWRAACLSTAVRELLDLTDGTPPRPVSSAGAAPSLGSGRSAS